MPSPQLKTFMILAHISISLELLFKLVARKLRMWAEGHSSDACHP